MAMTCQVCNNSHRLEIDRQLVQGISCQKIAKQYGVDSQAVWRHKENHLSRQLTKAWETKEAMENMDLLSRIDKLLSRTEKIFKRNFAREKDALALKALSEQRSTFELIAKISYALHQAKVAELEAAKMEAGYVDAEADAEFNEGLRRLTDAELILFEMLVDKVHGIITHPILKGGRYLGGGEKWFKMDDLSDKAREEIDWFHNTKKGPLGDAKPAETPSESTENNTPTKDIASEEKVDSQGDLSPSAAVKSDNPKTLKRTKYPKKYVVQERPPDKVKTYPRTSDLKPLPLVGDLKRSRSNTFDSPGIPFSQNKGLRIENHKVRND